MLRRAINPGLAGQAMVIKVSANLVVQAARRLHHHTTNPSLANDDAAATLAFAKPPPPFDWRQVGEFALYGIIGSQVGNVIQYVLEDWFPTRRGASSTVPAMMHAGGHETAVLGRGGGVAVDEKRLRQKDDDGPVLLATTQQLEEGAVRIGVAASSPSTSEGVLSWRNVLAKLVLDQTIGLFISGSVFLICTNFSRVPNVQALVQIVGDRIGALIRAGWHIWPLVAIVNFLWVPVRSRVLVAVIIGFGWSIFLSVFANNTPPGK